MFINTQPSGGGVYITDIAPTASGTVSNKVFEDDIVLKTCDSDTLYVTVSVLSISGPSHLIPRVTVNGTSVDNFALNAQMRYEGSCDIVLTDAAEISVLAYQTDGGKSNVIMTKVTGPTISNFTLTGGYPGSQTELKSGDTYGITFSTDKDINLFEISDFEAATSDTQVLSGQGPHNTSITIANRGVGTISNQRVKIRCRGTNGIWGDWKLSDVDGVGDGSAYVQLNNDAPVISSIAQGNITYPNTQAALKNSETAIVNHTITLNSGSFTVSYTSQNNDISIANDTVYETAKVVTRINGTYNISTNNLLITATKTSNGYTTTRAAIVYIAHAACTLAVTESSTRLRSGGNSGTSAQNHKITITASQRLLSAPSLVAPVGTWQGGGFSGTTTVWTRYLQIHDDDAKGVQNWGSISGTNLAGIETTAITGNTTYEVGGFVIRTLTVAAWPNRETSIGTQVSNTAKLSCTNNSKGVGYIVTFQASTTDTVDKFTITEPTTVYNATGNILYNCDRVNAIANGAGTATFTIEEIV